LTEIVSTGIRRQFARCIEPLAPWEFQQERERARRFLPSNAGKPWSNQEEAEVCDEIRRGLGFTDIAKKHNRTVSSTVARLVRLGTIRAGA
jgi:hypothetical protein